MVTDFNGSYFNDLGFQGQNATNPMGTTDQAVLYVFAPQQRQFEDVSLRPYQYSFDDNFLDMAQDVSNMNNQGLDLASTRISQLMDKTNLNSFMMPTQTPIMTFHASQLCQYYRFILLLTENNTGSIVTGNTVLHTNPNSQLRRIYTGYFTDEPYNPWSLTETRRSLNPNAKMVITHKTAVGTQLHSTPYGSQLNLNTKASEEIFQPAVAKELTSWDKIHNQAIHITTPENTVQALEEGDNNQIWSVPGQGNVLREDAAQVTHDYLSQPEHHVGHILKGIVSYKSDMVSLNKLASRRSQHIFNDDFTDDMTKRTKLAQKFALHRSMNVGQLDLDVNGSYSGADIDAMVGHRLQVIPIDHERPLFYDTADQTEASILNQYSFLIASVVCPILSGAGFNSMAFEYFKETRRGQVNEGFPVHAAEPLLPVPQTDWLNMVRAVQTELVNGIFDVIFQSKGDFAVAVKADCTGNTVVRLNLKSMGDKGYADFTIPSSLGGMISPLLGDTSTNHSNSSNMEGLISRVTGMDGAKQDEKDGNFLDLMGDRETYRHGDYPQQRLDYLGDRPDEDAQELY